MPELPKDAFPLLTRRDAVEFVRNELGIPLTESTLDKKRMKGEGPEPDSYWGKRELFTPKNIRTCALGLLTDEPADLGAA